MRHWSLGRWSALLLWTALAVADTHTLARVGGLSIEAASFRERALRVASLEWSELGSAWPERRRRLLDDVLIPEALLTLAAERQPAGLPSARDRALATVLQSALAAGAASAEIGADPVARYRDQHASELETPRSIEIWRILVRTQADASALIATLTPPSEAAFSRLARERSIDQATHMRAGNLGRVFADGQTHVPELRVSPALFEAADHVSDGDLVPEPVPEGEAFAVVWRRSSRAARSLAPAEATRWIAERLREERFGEDLRGLIERLRREHLVDYQPDRVASYEPIVPEPRRRPSRRLEPAPERRQPRLVPEASDRGLR